MGPQILKRFYSCTIESFLTGCITAWYDNCLASDRKALQRVVCTAQVHHWGRAPCHPSPLYCTRWCQRKALKIVKVSSHPSHRLFSQVSHSKRYQCSKSGTNRTLNSFYSQVIRLMNRLPGLSALTLFPQTVLTHNILYTGATLYYVLLTSHFVPSYASGAAV